MKKKEKISKLKEEIKDMLDLNPNYLDAQGEMLEQRIETDEEIMAHNKLKLQAINELKNEKE